MAVRKSDADLAKLLTDCNFVDVNAKDNFGQTALHVAVLERNEAMIKILVNKGANIHENNKNNRTPLFHAGISNDPEILELLINKHTDLNHRDKTGGSTILHHVAAYNYEAACRTLLQKGADPNVKDRRLLTPLFLASDFGNKNILELLLSRTWSTCQCETTKWFYATFECSVKKEL